MDIKQDDLTGTKIQALIAEHLEGMHEQTPPESVHALGLSELPVPEVTVWSVWRDSELLGCGALKEIDDTHGEIKSMRTATAHLRQGVAQRLLKHIVGEARQRGYRRLSLETGASPGFVAARVLYERYGFIVCGPFADYREDPHSVFMTLAL